MAKWKSGVLNQHQTSISLMTRIVDAVNIFGCLFVICLINDVEFSNFLWLVISATLIVFHILSSANSLYISWRGESIESEIKRLALVWVGTFIAIQFLMNFVFLKSSPINNSIFLQWGVFTFINFVVYRALIRAILRYLRISGRNTRTVAIVGAGDLGQQIASQLISSPWMGFDLKGFYDDRKRDYIELTSNSKTMTKIPMLGDCKDVILAAKEKKFDRVYIALPMRAEAKMLELVDELSDSTTSVYLVPDIFMFELLHARTEMVSGFPTISIFESPMDGSKAIVKRLEDIVLSISILALISIPMVVIATAVKLTSRGPAIFKQKRYGLDGNPIEVWKFRSMKVMENDEKVIQATKGDTRITTIGAFLRRTSLDELPQFINVLQGGMSIVGPRPHAVVHNEQYRKLIKGYMLRHKVKPGITGWAQINGWRGETDTLEKMEKRVEFDLEYIRNWSLWFDIKIVILTVFKGFNSKNAY